MECRQAVITIQAAVRCYQAHCWYKGTVKAIVCVQSCVRMYSARLHFRSQMLSIIIAQACCKGYLVRKRCLIARQSLIKVQAIARGYLARLRYEKCKAAVLTIQSHVRSWLVRHEIAKQVAAAVVIQRKYRNHCLKQQLSDARDFKPKCAIQSHSIAEMHRAATVVQAAWRGWHVRKHQKCPDIKKALVNVHAVNSTACESNQLKNCLPRLLEQLLHCKYLSTAAELLNRLVTMTEVSEKCSQVVVSYNTIPVLLNFITSTNRSMASLHVIKVVLKILLNICKWPATAGSVFQDSHSLSIFVDFMTKIYLSHHENMELMCQILSHYIHCCVHSKNISTLTNVDCRKLKVIKDTLEKKSKISQGKCHKTYANNLQCIKHILKVAGEV